jgi:PAS domain S-box-containing protein
MKSGEICGTSAEISYLKDVYKSNPADIVGILKITNKRDRSEKLKAYHNHLESLVLERTEELRSINGQLQKEILRRERAEQLLRHEKDRLKNYIDVVGVMIVVLDMDGRVSLINLKGAQLLGYDKDEIIGKKWITDFIPKDEQNKFNDQFSMCFKGDSTSNYESSVLTHAGEKKLISWTNVPLLDEHGHVIGCISAGEDITDIRFSQEKLRKYADDLRRTDELQLLFIDILSHDLLNPANVIKGYSEYLLETMGSKEEKAIVEKIHRQNENLIKIINAASTFGKLESTEMVSFEELDILDILRNVSREFLPLIEKKGMILECHAMGSYPAYANSMIEEAFSNLISNAIKFSPEGSRLILDIADCGSSWKVMFTDFGIGISDEYKEIIFTRFKRISGEGTKGCGLGLAIVKKIVELHGGEVGVYDNPSGQGSVFWIKVKKAQPS